MPHLKQLPTAEDGAKGLTDLVDKFGARNVFMFLGYVRDHREENPVPGLIRNLCAALMLAEAIAANPDLPPETVRRELANSLGYTVRTRTNFFKMIEAAREDLPGRRM